MMHQVSVLREGKEPVVYDRVKRYYWNQEDRVLIIVQFRDEMDQTPDLIVWPVENFDCIRHERGVSPVMEI